MTALMWAAREGTADITRVLLEAGASIEAKTTVSNIHMLSTCVCVSGCVCVLYSAIIVYDK